MPAELNVFLISMLPVSELRGAIPLAMSVYNMPVWQAFIWSVLGNLFVAVFVIWILDLLINKFLVHRIYILNRFFTWLFERTQRKYSKKIERWGDLALVIFVAIPLPGTGAWTGALIAFVFGIPLRRAFPAISLGVIIAGVIVSLIVEGVIHFPFI
ncbi:MAG: ligand-binding protein SH3 [Candidatus Portnoybacteria bacterium CG10_big_fil_rev_8_21_14_0_10_38_18]|uniref:Ligand-binding protein SH3 n=1 Tax=Candidatus Portnoybacteria bacterium CG10_big_fil_rev_8_21_14_0_10_38_18 TaxID=1974813 RepID=A0A2M8KCF4_9BACT|nr:MAG: ligand-binding protein SH3 [Candidatus Portnoybacteria bacterium CG10_big_fil_rev_8_21_14_0_10_38_18]